MRHIALYTRVSTEEQAAEGNSLDEQRQRLSSYCERLGLIPVSVYEDDGYSAKDMRRPALRRLREDVQSGRVAQVVTTRIDRLSRNLLDLLQLVDFLHAHDCSYKSALEPFDTGTSEGRMVLQLLGTFAEFERARIGERVRDNMLHSARRGGIVKTPPFGYEVRDRRYAVHPEQAEWYKRMVDMALEGRGTFQIAAALNQEGALTKGGRLFQARDVQRILSNDFYLGRTTWNTSHKVRGRRLRRPESEWVVVDGTHPALIGQADFSRLQAILAGRRSLSARAKSSAYLLSGLARCGHCGSKLSGSGTARRMRRGLSGEYVCQRHAHTGACQRNGVSARQLEERVLSLVEWAFRGAPPFPSPAAAEKAAKDSARRSRRLRRSLALRRSRLLEAYEAGAMTLQEFSAAAGRLDARLADLDRCEGKEDKEGGRPALAAVKEGPPHPAVKEGPPHPAVKEGPPHPTVKEGPPHPTVKEGPPHPDDWKDRAAAVLSSLRTHIPAQDIPRVKTLLTEVVREIVVWNGGEEVEIALV